MLSDTLFPIQVYTVHECSVQAVLDAPVSCLSSHMCTRHVKACIWDVCEGVATGNPLPIYCTTFPWGMLKRSLEIEGSLAQAVQCAQQKLYMYYSKRLCVCVFLPLCCVTNMSLSGSKLPPLLNYEVFVLSPKGFLMALVNNLSHVESKLL